MFFNCFDCKKVASLLEPQNKICSLCGSSNGEVISGSRLTEGMESGVFFNIDPKTGKRAKSKRR